MRGDVGNRLVVSRRSATWDISSHVAPWTKPGEYLSRELCFQTPRSFQQDCNVTVRSKMGDRFHDAVIARSRSMSSWRLLQI
jgi:hypothetical protein